MKITSDDKIKMRQIDVEIAEQIFGWQVLGYYGELIHDDTFSLTYGVIHDDTFSLELEENPNNLEPLYLKECQCDYVNKQEDLYKQRIAGYKPQPRLNGHSTLCLSLVPKFSFNIKDTFMLIKRMRILGYDMNSHCSGNIIIYNFSKEESKTAVQMKISLPKEPHKDWYEFSYIEDTLAISQSALSAFKDCNTKKEEEDNVSESI